MSQIAAPPVPDGALAAGPDFGLSEEQELLRAEVRRFAEERIRPGLEERDREHSFPAEIIGELGEMGLLGVMVDERYGGAGIGKASYVVVVEELARVCPSTTTT